MATWSQLLDQIKKGSALTPTDLARKTALDDFAKMRNRNVVCYYSGWLQRDQSEEVSITDNDMNGLMNALCDLDRDRGLDLVLHTPGGDLAATEAIVKYLRDCFHDDIVAIVPQMAMSAGTMIACSCKKIIMGRQSSLGPTDPQYGGVAAGGVVEEFEQAIQQIEDNPASAILWQQIIGKYPPTFLGDCEKAVIMSKTIVGDWLKTNMLSDDPEADSKIERIKKKLCDHSESVMHNRHFSHTDLEELGLNVELMEKDDNLQDKILTLHHAYMITFQNSGAVKTIESSNSSSWIVQNG